MCLCVCVCWGTWNRLGLCVHICVYVDVRYRVLWWLGSFGGLQWFSVSPLVAAVWSPVSPRKRQRVKQAIGVVHTSDQPACEGQNVKLSNRFRLFLHMSPHLKYIQMCTMHIHDTLQPLYMSLCISESVYNHRVTKWSLICLQSICWILFQLWIYRMILVWFCISVIWD